MDYRGKRIAVIGLGVSNTPLIEHLDDQGAEVSVFDRKEAGQLEKYLAALTGRKLCFHLGADYLTNLSGFDIIFLTPGMRKDLPEFEQAKAAGTIFSSEMEVFLNNAPGLTIGITGSSGKTTTTTLIGKMTAAQFGEDFVGGNIGRSLLGDLGRMDADSRIVLELSSFQLQMLRQSTKLALLTNITPNHLDMHASMEEYIDAKSNILRYQDENGIAILNYDDGISRNLKSLVRGKLFYFSRRVRLSQGAFLDGDKLVIKLAGTTEVIAPRSELKLLGDHNIENILAAALVARLAGVSLPIISQVVCSFNGVEHRLEQVREVNGVLYYNDSIATTPTRAIAGLKAMTRPTVLIAGGYDKNLPFEGLAAEIVRSCETLIVLGVTAPLISAAVKKIRSDFHIIAVDTFEAAVTTANQVASPGSAVLLSPACASYDMFDNYQQRGDLFKKLVNQF